MKKRFFFTVLFTVLATVTALATDFITDILLIGAYYESDVKSLKNSYASDGWIAIDKDLNDDCGTYSDYIYLMYKKASDQNETEFITDFYISNSSSTPATITYNNRTYHLAAFDGGDHFKNLKGDLNSNAGGDDIHLYYTKDKFPDNRAVSSIYFDKNQKGAVGKNGGSTGYDLNAGAGGEYIYMHFTTGTAVTLPTLPGQGTEGSPFIISNAADWVTFSEIINNGRHSDAYYMLSSSFDNSSAPVSQIIGLRDHPFRGHFNGNNRTLNVSISNDLMGAAPFGAVAGATIENVNVSGNVSCSQYHSAGLVGLCFEGKTLIRNCNVNTEIAGTGYAGGIVGHGGNGMLIIRNSVFGGKITGFDKFAGGILGWCDDLELNIINCLFKGSFSAQDNGCYQPIACKYGISTVRADITNAFYLNNIDPTVYGSNLILGSDGIKVSSSSTQGFEIEVTAADGITYYADNSKQAELSGDDYLQGLIDEYMGFTAEIGVEFSFHQGLAYGICLPFAMTEVQGGTVYKLQDVNCVDTYNGKAWVLTMNDVTPDDNLFKSTEAGMPYLFVSDVTGVITFKGDLLIPEYKTGYPLLEADGSNGWIMRGTYKDFAPDRSYGYIYSMRTASSSIDQHQTKTYYFYLNQESSHSSMHSYLAYTGQSDEIPELIGIRLVAKDGTDTAIGTINTTTGEIIIDTWYNMGGQRLNGAPTEPGLYIHNGKKVLINE